MRLVMDHHLNFCHSLDTQVHLEHNLHKSQLLLHKVWPKKIINYVPPKKSILLAVIIYNISYLPFLPHNHQKHQL